MTIDFNLFRTAAFFVTRGAKAFAFGMAINGIVSLAPANALAQSPPKGLIKKMLGQTSERQNIRLPNGKFNIAAFPIAKPRTFFTYYFGPRTGTTRPGDEKEPAGQSEYTLPELHGLNNSLGQNVGEELGIFAAVDASEATYKKGGTTPKLCDCSNYVRQAYEAAVKRLIAKGILSKDVLDTVHQYMCGSADEQINKLATKSGVLDKTYLIKCAFPDGTVFGLRPKGSQRISHEAVYVRGVVIEMTGKENGTGPTKTPVGEWIRQRLKKYDIIAVHPIFKFSNNKNVFTQNHSYKNYAELKGSDRWTSTKRGKKQTRLKNYFKNQPV